MIKKIPISFFLIIGCILFAQESTTQKINIVLEEKILFTVDQPIINFGLAAPVSPASLPLPIPGVKKALQMPASLRLFSTENYSLKVTFEPIQDGNLLEWDKNDILILSSEEFSTELLWDGTTKAVAQIIKTDGVPGSFQFFYTLSFARIQSLKKPGRLEGLITFTMSTSAG